mgnify:CR=1 FL=1
MKTRVSLALVTVAVLGLSACSHYSDDLAALDTQTVRPVQVAMTDEALATMTPAAGDDTPSVPFAELLAQEYLVLAKQNETAMDHKTARYFTVKAQAAKKGESVVPGTPEQFGISGARADAVRSARAQLTAALKQNMTPNSQYALAKAQAQYDCWLDDVQDGRGDTGPCVAGFKQSMTDVLAIAAPVPADIAPAAGEEVSPAPLVAPGTAPQAPAVAPQAAPGTVPVSPLVTPIKPAGHGTPAPLDRKSVV